jgi:hypothetical protein
VRKAIVVAAVLLTATAVFADGGLATGTSDAAVKRALLSGRFSYRRNVAAKGDAD